MKTDLVVAAYIIHNNKVLLIHHKKLDKWLPVGGHIDENETPDQALKREIKEETNLNVKIIGKTDIPLPTVKKNLATPFYVNVHSVGDHDHCCFYYVCKPLNPQELNINKELNDYKWFSKEKLVGVPVDVKNQILQAFSQIQ